MVCQGHRDHFLSGWGIWIWGRMSWEKWSYKTGLVPNLAPFQSAKGILVTSRPSLWLSLTQENHAEQATHTRKQEDSIPRTAAGRPGILRDASWVQVSCPQPSLFLSVWQEVLGPSQTPANLCGPGLVVLHHLMSVDPHWPNAVHQTSSPGKTESGGCKPKTRAPLYEAEADPAARLS